MASDGSSDENQTSVVRRENKDTRVNPMIQKVMLKKLHYNISYNIRGKSDLDFVLIQTKKVERKDVSSSDSEEEKDHKITVAYKSTRSAVGYYFLLLIF